MKNCRIFIHFILGNVYYYIEFLVLLLNINSQNIWFIPLIYFNGLFLKASTRKLYGCCEQLLLLLQMTSNAVPSVRDTSWFDHRVFPVLVFIWLRTLPCCLSLHTNKRSKGESVVLNTSPLHDSFKSLSQKTDLAIFTYFDIFLKKTLRLYIFPTSLTLYCEKKPKVKKLMSISNAIEE